IEAIYKAADEFDCDVINLSLGGELNMTSLERAVRHASDMGAIVVSAVGNKGGAALNYPAAYDCVVGVGAVGKSGLISDFSQRNSSVFVVAPGEDIVSLGRMTPKDYTVSGGTSFATPFAAAAAVLLKQYAPAATVWDFQEILRVSSTDGGTAGYDTAYGYGILNIGRFLPEMKAYMSGTKSAGFADTVGHWAEKSIDFCVANGYFTGVTESSFAPETLMDRAMFVTVLSRMSGETVAGYENVFSDVPDGAWFAQPSAWGALNGLVNGTGAGLFSPMAAVTREQIAVLLCRYALRYGLTDGSGDTAALAVFTDRGKVSDYAVQAMSWAVQQGLLSGRTRSLLSPRDSAKRSEVAAIISRFVKNFAA
ncbi:MAG: S8 family serine peptidase, partial [Oscillospiraceae bacterium]|nr:S8 family serine peptidase [Oscillospiraceae bacterium]